MVAGSDGDDVQTGGAGRDLLVDGLGFDLLRGDGGRDAFLYTEAALIGGSNALDGGCFSGGVGRDTSTSRCRTRRGRRSRPSSRPAPRRSGSPRSAW